MTFLPIVERELRVAARRPGTYRARWLVALLTTLIGTLVFLFLEGRPSAELGRWIFRGLSALCLVYCMAAGRTTTADCLSQEKREGTLGLLFLTDLRGVDVVLGKLAATSLNAVYGLLAVLPVLAVPLLLGGVGNGEFWRMVLVLLATIAFSLSVGLFGSACTRDVRDAYALNFGLLLGLGLLPSAGVGLVAAYWGAQSWFALPLATCPGFAFYCALDAPYLAAPGDYWLCIGLLSGLAGLGVALAGRIAPRSWQDRPVRQPVRGWRQRWHDWNFGPASGRLAFRRELLDQNAFLWLAGRPERKARHVWVFLGLMGLWALGGWLVEGRMWLDESVAFTLAFIVNLGLKLWLALEAGQRVAEDKKAGALELLLTTPLHWGDIFRGQMLALRRQFLGPLLVAVGSETALAAGWSHLHNQEFVGWIWVAGITLLVLDCATLALVSLTRARTAKSVQHALLGTIARVLVLPWVAFIGILGGLELASLLWTGHEWMPPEPVNVALWFGLGLAADLAFGLPAWWFWRREWAAAPVGRDGGGPLVREPAAAAAPVVAPGLPRARRLRSRWGRAAAALTLAALGWWGWRGLYPPPPPVALVRSNPSGPPGAAWQIAPGMSGAYLLLPDGSLWGWGRPELDGRSHPSPEPLVATTDWRRISAAGAHALALRGDGRLWEWGWGQRNGGFQNVGLAGDARPLFPERRWREIAANVDRGLGVAVDGTLWEWGQSGMGPGAGGLPFAFWQVGTNRDWAEPAALFPGRMARRADGSLWHWGGVYQARVYGNGASLRRLGADTGWVAIGGGDVPWALNRKGELWSVDPMPMRPVPGPAALGALLADRVSPDGFAVAATAAGRSLFVRRPDGTLWERTLGPPPGDEWRRVGGRKDWVWLQGTGATAFGGTADDTLWIWGEDFGRLDRPDLTTRWRYFQARRRLTVANVGGGVAGGRRVPLQREPRPILRWLSPGDGPAAPR